VYIQRGELYLKPLGKLTFSAYTYSCINPLPLKLVHLEIQIEDKLIQYTISLISAVALRSSSIGDSFNPNKSQLLTPLNTSVSLKLIAPFVYIRDVLVHPLSLLVTFKATAPVHISLDHTSINLSSLKLKDTFASMDRLVKEVAGNYIADALLLSPMLVGSLDILGNPAMIIRNVSSGIYDVVHHPFATILNGGRYDIIYDFSKEIAFIYMPLFLLCHAICALKSASEVLSSAATGFSSLAVNVSEAALVSVHGFSSSISHNLNSLSNRGR
jgi:hypothetical protein